MLIVPKGSEETKVVGHKEVDGKNMKVNLRSDTRNYKENFKPETSSFGSYTTLIT